MTTGQRMKKRRKELGLSAEKIAEVLCVSPATIYRYENGGIDKVPGDRLLPIAEALQTTPAHLMGWEEAPTPPAPNLLPAPTMVRKPRLGHVACGQPILAEQNIETYDLVPSDIKCDFTLVCKGDSMINARIFDGDIVCIRQQPQVENGEIAAVMVGNEEATLKRVRLFEDHISLEPENPMHKPLVLWGEDMNKVRIIGKATHFISNVR